MAAVTGQRALQTAGSPQEHGALKAVEAKKKPVVTLRVSTDNEQPYITLEQPSPSRLREAARLRYAAEELEYGTLAYFAKHNIND